MPTFLEGFLQNNANKISKLSRRPLILKWLDSSNPNMVEALPVIDKHVCYLQSQPGGVKKLKDWFLSGDLNFATTTAERYIIKYLCEKNSTIHDLLNSNGGVDASLAHQDGHVGIEITTLNQFIAEWIFTERLEEFCQTNSFFYGKGFEITYSFERIQQETEDHTVYQYIQDVESAIVASDEQQLLDLQIEVEEVKIGATDPRYISWKVKEPERFRWYPLVTSTLARKLVEGSKLQQLQANSRNLVFVGVNNLSPINLFFPSLFASLDSGEKSSYWPQVQALRQYWAEELPKLPNVIGLCFFIYSLEREEPFYPLVMLWRSEDDKIEITL